MHISMWKHHPASRMTKTLKQSCSPALRVKCSSSEFNTADFLKRFSSLNVLHLPKKSQKPDWKCYCMLVRFDHIDLEDFYKSWIKTRPFVLTTEYTVETRYPKYTKTQNIRSDKCTNCFRTNKNLQGLCLYFWYFSGLFRNPKLSKISLRFCNFKRKISDFLNFE